jgi:NADH:ubiquinone oxidoreductase subunit H
MTLGWTYLLPIALVNVLIVAAGMMIYRMF